MLRTEHLFQEIFHEEFETSGSPTNEVENVQNPISAESLALERPRSSAHVFGQHQSLLFPYHWCADA
jgi:hypothetical protein